MLINVFIWDKHASPTGLVFLFGSLCCAYFYKQVPSTDSVLTLYLLCILTAPSSTSRCRRYIYTHVHVSTCVPLCHTRRHDITMGPSMRPPVHPPVAVRPPFLSHASFFYGQAPLRQEPTAMYAPVDPS